jgi:hypothetical protein
MINPNDLVMAMVAAFGNIPELVAVLAPVSPIAGHLDNHPASLAKAVYQMQPGSVLVAWQETRFREGETEPWEHVVEIFVRALKGQSNLDVAVLLINGVPVPGDGLPWRFCPLLAGVLPTIVQPIARTPDAEQIDLVTISTETLETGDTLPASGAQQKGRK